MSQIKKLFGETAIYGASSVFGRAINFLLVPLYTSVFEPGQYGVVTELYAYVAFLMVIYLYGLETTFFRFATKYSDQTKTFDTMVTLILFISVLLSSLFMIFSSPIAEWLDYPESGQYITWLAVILALDSIVAVPFARLRLNRKAARFATIKMANIAINIGLNLFFLVFARKWGVQVPEFGVGYVFLSNLIASAFTLLVFLPDLARYRPGWDRGFVGELMTYSTPLVFIGLAGVTNEMLSRAMLRHWLPEGFYPGFTNLAILGIFGACYKLSMLMNLSVQSFRYAYEPFFFSRSIDKDSPEMFARVMNAFIIFGGLAFMGISIILPEFAPLVLRQRNYLEALHVVPILLFGGLLLGIHYNLSVWYKVTDQTSKGAIITLIGAVATVILNIILIPIMGYEGSAWATLGVFMLMVVISYVWGQYHFPVPYRLIKGVIYLVFSGVPVAVLWSYEFSIAARYMIGGLSIIIYLILAFVMERSANSTADHNESVN